MTEETMGERIRRRRRELGISTAEFGRRAALAAGRDKPISPSAIRNQENGTNGTPVLLVEAYAEVLGVDRMWLMWGMTEAETTALWLKGEEERERATYSTIVVAGSISAGWAEPTLPPDSHARYIYISLPQYRDSHLVAYEVVDDTLSPTYPRGTYLICTRLRSSNLRDGDHVIVATVDPDGISLRTIREARLRGGANPGADLAIVGRRDVAPTEWFFDADPPRAPKEIVAQELVVAHFRQLPQEGRGDLIRLPDQLRPSLEKAEEAFGEWDTLGLVGHTFPPNENN